MPQQQSPFPPIPPEALNEGARWRHHKPSGEDVAKWFSTQPLDDGMEHADYVGGVVIIPLSEKVKYAMPDGTGTAERYEQVFTPYVQIGTRLGYFRRLAEHRNLIPVVEAETVPRSQNPTSPFFNGHMPPGLWWHVVFDEAGQQLRYLCATARVSMYTPQGYMDVLSGKQPLPMLSGTGTKQVSGGPDPNGVMKAQTGAIGRALGVAGILVVGTGIATAEDMQEFSGTASAAPSSDLAQLPDTQVPKGQMIDDSPDALRSRIMALQVEMQERAPASWTTFVAWWTERARAEGWRNLEAVPVSDLRTVLTKMERDYAAGVEAAARDRVARDQAAEAAPQAEAPPEAPPA